jgi:HPt (histidine-containing phosphotransfer) domain-containing protein
MNALMVAMILFLLLIAFITYLIINNKIKKQRKALMGEILDFLNLGNIDSLLKIYDDQVTVKSKKTLENYDNIKYLKEHENLDEVKHIVLMRQDIKRVIVEFLKWNEFMQRPQYKYVANWLNGYLPLAEGFRARIIYITSAGNNRGERLISFFAQDVKEFEQHPEYLMTKGEYNKMLKQQAKEELEEKKHDYYDKVNSIIDLVNDSKDGLIVKSKEKKLNELIQQLFDRTINSIQKVKQIDSDEWDILDNFISGIDSQVNKIIDDDKLISSYYASSDFAKIKETCNSLNVSRKEFNDYIEEKAQSISKLFGTRIVRNETQNADVYNYIRAYKKSITPFTAEVSAAVFGSAENNPIDYIIKYFYPNKSQYKEQIQKLKVLIEELETLKEAKVIIDNYKKDYEQYIQNVPDYVLENDEDGFYQRLGLAIIDEAVLNVEYRFTYTSGGGMAQRSFTVPMNEENIIELINRLESKLTQQALSKEQRALMTSKLRAKIKERDNYTC